MKALVNLIYCSYPQSLEGGGDLFDTFEHNMENGVYREFWLGVKNDVILIIYLFIYLHTYFIKISL